MTLWYSQSLRSEWIGPILKMMAVAGDQSELQIPESDTGNGLEYAMKKLIACDRPKTLYDIALYRPVPEPPDGMFVIHVVNGEFDVEQARQLLGYTVPLSRPPTGTVKIPCALYECADLACLIQVGSRKFGQR